MELWSPPPDGDAPAKDRRRSQPEEMGLFAFFIPFTLWQNADSTRHAKLIVGFGTLGAVFGLLYAIFYIAIGHYWGAAVIGVCSICVAAVPWMLRQTARVDLAGNADAFILTVGFTILSAIEGGLRGHAVAWLAGVPLCALLLVGKRAGIIWAAICFSIILVFARFEYLNIAVPMRYPGSLQPLVSAAGFLGLPIFMCVLGVLFEIGRERAFNKMSEALGDLSMALQQLLKLNVEKSEFLSIAAHDLKTPLQAITGLATLMRDSPGDEKTTRADAEEIIVTSRRMLELIGNLLDINAIEEGKFPFDLQPLDLVELSRQIVSTFRNVAGRKTISILFEPPEEAVVCADARATFQVIENLVSNAIKYSPPGKQVRIRILRSGERVVLEVEDEGPGLSKADQQHLFEKFARLGPRPTGNEPSTGLGLSIVKRMIEAMNGVVACRSAPGSGATFSIALPAWHP